jgi:hypothetical protein
VIEKSPASNTTRLMPFSIERSQSPAADCLGALEVPAASPLAAPLERRFDARRGHKCLVASDRRSPARNMCDTLRKTLSRGRSHVVPRIRSSLRAIECASRRCAIFVSFWTLH